MKLSSARLHTSSSDGYVRVPEHTLTGLKLVHVSSGIDEGLRADLRADAIDVLHAGYTEWQRAPHPGSTHVSVGWDWYLDGASGAFLIAWNDVRSNIMGVDCFGTDLGVARTAQMLIRRLTRLNWPCTVAVATPLSMREQLAVISSLQ
jgi:hypothetical protein